MIEINRVSQPACCDKIQAGSKIDVKLSKGVAKLLSVQIAE